MYDFLDWLGRAGGIIAIFVGLLGFLFREKWKQLLQRSMSEDLARLNSDLIRKQAEHAASLAPQLAQIEHDFQQKLEAYKVSLIADAEAAKAKSELRKTIALRFADVQFERLVALEKILSPLASDVLSQAGLKQDQKNQEQQNKMFEQLEGFRRASNEAEMFLSVEVAIACARLLSMLKKIVGDHVGFYRPTLSMDDPQGMEVVIGSAALHERLKEQICALGHL